MAGSERSAKERLDVLLVERGLAASREKARALILAGRVLSSGKRLDKPGTRVARCLPLEVEPGRRWVGRGAEKLLPALRRFGVDPRGREDIDVGASTGGFTQVLLETGASRVVALDVGRGQLDWTLRNDPRVHVVEGLNARHLEARDLPFAPSLAVVDVSFISLRLVLPAVAACLTRRGEIVALVKPQFEVGRESVGRGGIVRDPALHRRVLEDVARLADERGWAFRALCPAAVTGAEGNQEYFVHLGIEGEGLAADERARALDAATAPRDEDRE